MENLIKPSFYSSSRNVRKSGDRPDGITFFMEGKDHLISFFKWRSSFIRLLFSVVVNMVEALNKLKIAQTIIEAIMVLMMDMLIRLKFSSELLFHQVTMFKNILFSNTDGPIFARQRTATFPSGISISDVILSIKSTLTSDRAKIIFVPFQCPRIFFNYFSALVTRCLHIKNYTIFRSVCQFGGGLPL